MAYASRSGRARTSIKRPQAFFVCDRCGIWGNRADGIWQYEWRGTSLQNLWILVCHRCLDVPQEQLRAIQLPADPVPIWQPRVEQFEAAETNYRTTLPIPTDPITGLPIPAQTSLRVTQDSQNRITQPIGCPEGLVQNAVMPRNGGQQKSYAVPLAILSVTANGTATVNVTCSKPHGLTTNDQISAEGLTCANGFHSVTVLTATAFTFLTAYDIAAGSLLQPATRIGGLFNQAGQPVYNQNGIQLDLESGPAPGDALIVTADAGLPYGSDTIPPLGCKPVRTAGGPLLNQSGQQIYNQAGQPILTK